MESPSEGSKRDSSRTTSVPEFSSLSTLSSSNKSLIVNLRNRVELLQIQLKQKETELDKEKLEKEGGEARRAEIAALQAKCGALSTICNQLSLWMRQIEQQENVWYQEIEGIYKKNLEQLGQQAAMQLEENGKLRKELRENEAKVATIVQENAFLRFDNKNLTREIQKLHDHVEKEGKNGREIEHKLNIQKTTFEQITRTQSARAQQEVLNVIHSSTCEVQRMKRVQEDREKEYGITLSRMNNELVFLQKEVKRKEEENERMTGIVDGLVEENRRLLETIQVERDEKQTNGNEQLEEQLRHITGEYEAEKQQREELTRIQLRMGHDMKRLLSIVKEKENEAPAPRQHRVTTRISST